MRRSLAIPVIVVAGLLLSVSSAFAGHPFSFGEQRDRELGNMSKPLFGVGDPVDESSAAQITQADAQADPTRLATLAEGLKARVVTTQGPAVDDQISLWPDDKHPT